MKGHIWHMFKHSFVKKNCGIKKLNLNDHEWTKFTNCFRRDIPRMNLKIGEGTIWTEMKDFKVNL